MNKAGLAEAVRSLHGGVSGPRSVRIVDAVFERLAAGLAAGGTLRIRGFGSLAVVRRQPRRGAAPSGGRIFVAPAHRALSFRPSRSLVRDLESR